tara:strand:+ start:2829 stop:3953 length:1125 start_codon:yes stop_codon:yes gene_type:complete
MYFIGNVLSPTLTQPEQEDPTFAFTYGEAQMDMNGVPICMEHDEKMQVGTIKQSWNQIDGSKWIVGKIDDASMFGHFARNAVQKSSNGTRYYTGLSLTHTHTQYANGKTEKAPIEVSLCVDPRRSDCRIMFVDESCVSAMDQRKILTYKASMKTKKMSAPVADTPMIDATPTPVVPVVPTPVEQVKDEVVPNQESLMKMIVDQQKDMERLETQAKELAELKSELAEKKKKEFEVASAKSEAMAKALVESWSQTLDQGDMNDSSRASILELAKKFPHESQEFFRVAHNASKKSLAREKELKEAAEAFKNADLKKDFSKVMNKTTHVASKKKAPEPKSDEIHFMDAVRKYRVSGSGRALMEQVADIGNIKKRRRMF